MIEATVDGVMILDEEGRIEYVNPGFTRLTGHSANEVIGRQPSLLQSGRHGPDFHAKMRQELLDIGHWQGKIWNRRKDESIFDEWLTIDLMMNAF